MLLCNMRQALHAPNDFSAHDNFVRNKKRGFELFRLKVVNEQPWLGLQLRMMRAAHLKAARNSLANACGCAWPPASRSRRMTNPDGSHRHRRGQPPVSQTGTHGGLYRKAMTPATGEPPRRKTSGEVGSPTTRTTTGSPLGARGQGCGGGNSSRGSGARRYGLAAREQPKIPAIGFLSGASPQAARVSQSSCRCRVPALSRL
jgi:hypothetical protein